MSADRKRLLFLWLPEHQMEFDRLKAILTSDLIVKHFGSSNKTVLLTDATRLFGLSYSPGHIKLNKGTTTEDFPWPLTSAKHLTITSSTNF